MQAGDDDVLVVAGIADNARYVPSPFATRGTSSWTPPVPILQLRADRPVPVGDVQIGAQAGAAAEHRVEVQRRRTGVGRDQRVLGHAQLDVWSKVMS